MERAFHDCVVIIAAIAALPWLQGFFLAEASSDRGSYDCGHEDADPMTIRADVADAPGVERIVTSYRHGTSVYDQKGRAIASAPGFACEGSADELVSIAAGDGAIGVPLIAFAQTAGGHSESRTTLRLYRVAADGTLAQVFAGDVEHHTTSTRTNERVTRTGTVTLIPGGLVYRDPLGSLSVWVYDASAGSYLEVDRPRDVAPALSPLSSRSREFGR